MERRRAAANIALVFVVLFALTGLVSVLVFDAGSIMMVIPLVSASVKGIQSALAGDYSNAAINSIVLIIIPIACVLIGKKIA